MVAINTQISAVQEVSLFAFGKCTERPYMCSLLGLPSRRLQVAPHVSGVCGRFINGKLTERPQSTIDDKAESLPRTAGFTLRQAFLITSLTSGISGKPDQLSNELQFNRRNWGYHGPERILFGNNVH